MSSATEQFVPQDGRDEYADGTHTLKPQTTLFQSRVPPAINSKASAYMIFGKFFGLTLSHPCTVLIQHLLIDERKPAGQPVIYEYETRAPVKLKNYGYMRYDEVYLPSLKTENARDSLAMKRAYFINGDIIQRSSVLAFTDGNDGRDAKSKSVTGRWKEPPFHDAPFQVASLLAAHYDRDYLHMLQCWEKSMLPKYEAMTYTGMTLCAIIAGVETRGRVPTMMQRHVFCIYDVSRRFDFSEPVVYRDDGGDGDGKARTSMPYLVAIVVAFTGTRDYDQHFPIEEGSPRSTIAPIVHQGEIFPPAVEHGYETRVYPLIDRLLADLPWTADDPVQFECRSRDAPRFPRLLAKFADLRIACVMANARV